MSTKLEQYREEIVSINNQILELLSKRGELAQKIGEEKIKQGTKVYDPQREKEMINELMDRNQGPLMIMLLSNYSKKSSKRQLTCKNLRMKTSICIT